MCYIIFTQCFYRLNWCGSYCLKSYIIWSIERSMTSHFMLTPSCHQVNKSVCMSVCTSRCYGSVVTGYLTDELHQSHFNCFSLSPKVSAFLIFQNSMWKSRPSPINLNSMLKVNFPTVSIQDVATITYTILLWWWNKSQWHIACPQNNNKCYEAIQIEEYIYYTIRT